MPTAYAYTTGCYQCVRAGWLWCSAKWHYEEPSPNTTYDDTTEKGSCCYATKLFSYVTGSDNGVSLNNVNCPALYSNLPNTSLVAITSSLWWCSD